MVNAPRASWIDQFVLRGPAPGGALSPFRQAILAGEQLARVAEDRSGLPRAAYDALGTARHQARLLSELARMLDEDVASLARKVDNAPSPGTDPVGHARVLAVSLSGVVRATATLLDTCHSMLLLAEQLLVVHRTRSRLELMAAVETLRGAASTAHLTVLANLPRLTDSVLYDELASGLGSVEVTLSLANRLSETIRSEMSLRPSMPPQRAGVLELS
ncbi:MAG TPA: cyclodeaminase/cyclohydrolase family protein [Nocardioidaceae bacterium]|nr:cyclodeaminase/cyclohydrolase family protein [Nocardioidaceae bacterium]